LGYLYYPGCTLKESSAELMERTALQAAAELGVPMEEMENWQCCGAVYPLTEDEIITLVSPARTLYGARGSTLVTLCSACHHVLKRTQHRLSVDKEVQDKISSYLEQDYPGESPVKHFLEVLRDLGWDVLAEKIKNPLTGRRIAAYYGCMLLRPVREIAFDNPERPRIMEDFIRALGAEAITFPFRNKCCGAYLAVTEKKVMEDTSQKILEMALEAGAEELITACPLCYYNLTKTAGTKEHPIKISYFSEPLAEALSLKVQEVKL
jgi:heterodisulfide reductase subunit B